MASPVEEWPRKVRDVLGPSAVDLLGLDAATWKPQSLHAATVYGAKPTATSTSGWNSCRHWAIRPKQLAFTVLQDFEGDQFTFFKFPPKTFRPCSASPSGTAIYDSLEAQTLEQLRRGRPVLIEVDSHWLPDAAPAYRRHHAKSTVAAVR